MGKTSWATRSAVAATALLGALAMVQQAAAAAGHHQQVAHRAAPVDPVRFKAWMYPSKDPLSPTAWVCFSTPEASSPELTCGQESVPAQSGTPSVATDPTVSTDPVDLKAWMYPSKDPLSPTAWVCFSTPEASSPELTCGQESVPALSGTPSGL
jgi:hypothetical protein